MGHVLEEHQRPLFATYICKCLFKVGQTLQSNTEQERHGLCCSNGLKSLFILFFCLDNLLLLEVT